jgi:predicted secreted Zn-dependent protease
MIFSTALALAMGLAQPASDPVAGQGLVIVAPELAAMPEVTVTTYPVEGRNARIIRQNMNRVRPREASGEAFDALTTWQFSSRWKTQGGQCLPQTIEVKVTVGVTLPQLTHYDRLSRSDRQKWDRYFAALVQHETNHVRIAITGSQLMQEQLRQSASCEGLEAVGRELAEGVAQASRAYDDRTDHGKREGAVFP